MEKDLIGRKVKGFKFEETEKELSFHTRMESYIGQVGVIQSYDKDYDCYRVDFPAEQWCYPASLIEPHLVEEENIDVVNNPSHYTDGNIEVIDYISDKKLGFCLGNAVKYISRAGKKDPNKTAEDIEKSIWYLKRYLKELADNKS